MALQLSVVEVRFQLVNFQIHVLEFQGFWDAQQYTNPYQWNGTPGFVYEANVAGTANLALVLYFAVGDYAISRLRVVLGKMINSKQLLPLMDKPYGCNRCN